MKKVLACLFVLMVVSSSVVFGDGLKSSNNCFSITPRVGVVNSILFFQSSGGGSSGSMTQGFSGPSLGLDFGYSLLQSLEFIADLNYQNINYSGAMITGVLVSGNIAYKFLGLSDWLIPEIGGGYVTGTYSSPSAGIPVNGWKGFCGVTLDDKFSIKLKYDLLDYMTTWTSSSILYTSKLTFNNLILECGAKF